MEEMINAVKSVLKKYGKTYSRAGIVKNLTAWRENKGTLLNLLRLHPCWNEEAKAVVLEFLETREIDEAKTLESLSRVEFLHPVFDNNHVPPIYQMNDYAMYCNALYEAATPFQKNISGEIAESVKQYADIKCVEGEKCSKVLNKVCESYAVNTHSQYNKLFAKLSDNVSPHAIKRKMILSVHPCDFLEMSNRDNSWSSCHKLNGGGYQAGTISYMNDGVSMVLYSISEKETGSVLFKIPKVTREVFCYSNGVLLQSRLYPADDGTKMKHAYGEIVKEIIAACYQTDSNWAKYEEVRDYCNTHERGKHYADYNNGYGEVFLLRGASFSYETMTIGAESFCMYCGDAIYNTNGVLCNGSCKYQGMRYCDICGEDIEEYEDINTEVGNPQRLCRQCFEQQQTANDTSEFPAAVNESAETHAA